MEEADDVDDDHDSGEEEDDDDDEDAGEERHMSAHACSAPTALAAATMQGLAGLEQLPVCVLLVRSGGAVLLLLLVRGGPTPTTPAWWLLLLGTGMLPPACAKPVAGSDDGGVTAVVVLPVPSPPRSHDSQASRSGSVGWSGSASKSEICSDSSLPPGDVPMVPAGSKSKLLVPRGWASSGYKLHSIVGWHGVKRRRTLPGKSGRGREAWEGSTGGWYLFVLARYLYSHPSEDASLSLAFPDLAAADRKGDRQGAAADKVCAYCSGACSCPLQPADSVT
jgi:hypothetical protein